MNDEIAISAEGVSKKYILGKSRIGYGGLRHVAEDMVKAPIRWIRGQKKQVASDEEFWALRNVSFEIKKGEVVGIIGRNGAGKSTLLKVLSRITEPTTGRIGIKGRIASLLEVGTGFHPELTGRENIFLNGAILGMTNAEVRRKLDEIIAFAGVERFLETPVKRYSSGMYVRLAFAVAAHLEPEILVVDEVLAVGDSEFQKKCLGKMKEVTKGGRTVLFVSHNLPAVAALCQSGIYLKSGQLVMTDTTDKVLDRYKGDVAKATEEEVSPEQAQHRSGTGTHRMEKVEAGAREFSAREPITFKTRIKRYRDEGPFHFSLHFRDEWDTEVFTINTEFIDGGQLSAGDQEISVKIESPWLPPGDYRADAYLHSSGIIDQWTDACRFGIRSDVATDKYSAASAKNPGKVLAGFDLKVVKN